VEEGTFITTIWHLADMVAAGGTPPTARACYHRLLAGLDALRAPYLTAQPAGAGRLFSLGGMARHTTGSQFLFHVVGCSGTYTAGANAPFCCMISGGGIHAFGKRAFSTTVWAVTANTAFIGCRIRRVHTGVSRTFCARALPTRCFLHLPRAHVFTYCLHILPFRLQRG